MTRCRRLLAAAISLTAMLAVFSGCTEDPPAAAADSVSGSVTESRTPSPSARADKEHPAKSMAVRVFYARGRSDHLLGKRVRVPLGEGPALSALMLAADEPSEGHWRAVVPANSFAHAGFDGVGSDGAFWIEVTQKRVSATRFGLTRDEARLAVRAVICTLQGLGGDRAGGKQPVDVYPPGGGEPVRRLFGVRLPEAENNRLDVACGR